jgi:hypothetical protein
MADEASTVADPTTERMRQETGHDCIACPTRVRDLMATAHNALGEWGAITDARGVTDWTRLHRKMAELQWSLDQLELISDAHFEALDAWRRP